jgi:hypothetical protein
MPDPDPMPDPDRAQKKGDPKVSPSRFGKMMNYAATLTCGSSR